MRRRIALVTVLMVALGGCGWFQYRGDAAHTGYQPFETKISTSNVGQLTREWTASPGYTSSSPAVANGVLYAGAAPGLFAYDAAGGPNCADLKPCAPLWAAAIGSVQSSPAVVGGVVYVTTDLGVTR